MPEALYSLALLACPVGMGLMMWFMMKGKKSDQSGTSAQSPEPNARVAQLQAELDQVKAQLRDETAKPPTRAD